MAAGRVRVLPWPDALNTALAATITGGTVVTAAKEKAYDAVANALNADANDVENVVGTDMEICWPPAICR